MNLESLIEDFEGLWATNCHVGRDLVVTADAELRDSAMRAGEYGFLASELLDDTGRTSDLITHRAWVDVDADLSNADSPVLVLFVRRHERPAITAITDDDRPVTG